MNEFCNVNVKEEFHNLDSNNCCNIFSVTVGRRLIGFEAGSSFISTLGSLIVMGVGLGSFYMLKRK